MVGPEHDPLQTQIDYRGHRSTDSAAFSEPVTTVGDVVNPEVEQPAKPYARGDVGKLSLRRLHLAFQMSSSSTKSGSNSPRAKAAMSSGSPAFSALSRSS